MTEHFNELTPAEAERLALLIEECAEVQAIACKILRHGYESFHPHDPGQVTNRRLLMNELGDLEFAIALMAEGAQDVDRMQIVRAQSRKRASVAHYLHHQDDVPLVANEHSSP